LTNCIRRFFSFLVLRFWAIRLRYIAMAVRAQMLSGAVTPLAAFLMISAALVSSLPEAASGPPSSNTTSSSIDVANFSMPPPHSQQATSPTTPDADADSAMVRFRRHLSQPFPMPPSGVQSFFRRYAMQLLPNLSIQSTGLSWHDVAGTLATEVVCTQVAVAVVAVAVAVGVAVDSCCVLWWHSEQVLRQFVAMKLKKELVS